MRVSELRDKKIRSLDGEALGRVHEVHCDNGKVTALMCRLGSLIERWTGKREGHRIAWKRITKITDKHIIVAPEMPQPKTKVGASRSPRGIRRPSAPRSKR